MWVEQGNGTTTKHCSPGRIFHKILCGIFQGIFCENILLYSNAMESWGFSRNPKVNVIFPSEVYTHFLIISQGIYTMV